MGSEWKWNGFDTATPYYEPTAPGIQCDCCGKFFLVLDRLINGDRVVRVCRDCSENKMLDLVLMMNDG